jgi:hypothetical protein
MPNKSAGAGPRSFNAMLVTNLSDEARKAVNEAFDAISNWRSETFSNSEKNSGQVIEKMAAAARALGWPEQGVKFCRDFRLSGLVPAVSGQVSSIKMFQKPKEFARHFKWQSLNRHLRVRVLPAQPRSRSRGP